MAASKKKRARTPRRPPDGAGGAARAVAALLILGVAAAVFWSYRSGAPAPGPAAPSGHGADPLVNTTARGETLVEIPSPEQVAAMTDAARLKARGEVFAALATVPAEAVREGAPAGRPVVHGVLRPAPGYRAAGKVMRYRTETGDVVRLQDLDVSQGPDAHVLLLDRNGKSVDLGPLRSARGDQNYPLPAGIKAEAFTRAAVYCKLFDFVIAEAALKAD